MMICFKLRLGAHDHPRCFITAALKQFSVNIRPEQRDQDNKKVEDLATFWI